MFRWGSRKAKDDDVDEDFDDSSTRRNNRRSKPRKPEDEDENERSNDDDMFKARKPPSRAHVTDEELVREWYAIFSSTGCLCNLFLFLFLLGRT